MKKYFKITVFILLGTPIWGQVRQERDYVKSFLVEKGDKVEITNKYGEVIVHTWHQDSVKLKVVVKSEGKSSAAVSKDMSRIEVEFHKKDSKIVAQTKVESSGFIFGSVMTNVVGGGKLSVDYEIWMPEDVDLHIDNKYGDVFLPKMSSRVVLTVAHGDIKADELSQPLQMNHHFGKAYFDRLSFGTLSIRGVELQIDQARKLTIESASSEITINDIDYMQLNSRNDKVSLSKVDEMVCKGTFTYLTADVLSKSARLDFNYGDIYFKRIARDFSNIDIKGKSADINLVLNQASYINAYIRGREDKMLVPNSMLTLKKQVDEDEGIIVLSGFVGNTQEAHGDLKIDANDGEIIIAIKETPIFVDRD